MEILHVTHHFWPCVGGIERAIEDLCIELIKKGHKCKVLCLNKCARSQKKLAEKEIHKGITIVRVPFIDLKYYKIAFGSLLKHARNADIVHVHGLGFFSDLFLLTKPLHRKPVVVSSYGAVFHTGSNPFKDMYFFIWCRFLLKFADKIVVVSKHDRAILSKIAPENKLEFIPVPVTSKKFHAGKKKKNTFVFVGRISRNKRIDLLIDTFVKASQDKKAKLFIVGYDFENLLPKLKNKLNILNANKKVVFLGPLLDRGLVRLLANADFFISASDYESFGISAIEGMASGCIPILSNIPSFRAFIKKEKNGFLLDFHNTEKASKKLAQIMELPQREKERLRKNAMAYAKTFDPKKITSKLLALYSQLHNKRR